MTAATARRGTTYYESRSRVGAGDGAPDQPLHPLEEVGAVQYGVPEPRGDAVVRVVGALVMDVVVLFGEDHTPGLQPAYKGRRGVHVRPFVELVGKEGGEAQEKSEDPEEISVVRSLQGH